MKLLQKFFKNDQKLNANEIAVEIENEKYQQLDNYLKKFNLTRVWENNNHHSNFSAQNITLSSSDYDYLIVFFKLDKNQENLMSTMTLKGYGFTLNGGGNAHAPGSASYVGSTYVRHCSRVSDTEYSVPTTNVYVGNTTTAGSDANVYLIPAFIYAGKF